MKCRQCQFGELFEYIGRGMMGEIVYRGAPYWICKSSHNYKPKQDAQNLLNQGECDFFMFNDRRQWEEDYEEAVKAL